uniref:Disintegrin and metalloproteinase domain-containing protein 2 n=1 Tax=Otolemur garnettii TaxID=30611 RepID=H0WJY3_OTOGA
MLPVLLILSGLNVLSGLSTGTDSQRLPLQVIIPEKVQSVLNEEIEIKVSYKIIIQGQTFILNLKQRTFLPSNFIVYGYNNAEVMKPIEEKFRNFCYYQGYIEGYPHSMVIISTCHGIRGLIQFENVSYVIEPLGSSLGSEHLVYEVTPKNPNVALYTDKALEPRETSYKIKSVEPHQSSQYIEMHLVVEQKLYNHMGSDISVVTQKIFQLLGLTNAIFTSFNVTVILSSLELWVDKNKIPITGDANELLHRFLDWKRSFLVLRPHDVAFLLIYREKSNYVGATFQGKMCDALYGGGVVMHPKTISVESLAVILTQLLALSMGIPYDDTSKCQCSGAICIMNPQAIHFSGVKMFSNCSMEDFAHFISKQKSQCLQNHPRLDPSYKQNAVCGNKVVDAGEDCDCGSQENCPDNEANCCNVATCKFTDGSTCYKGVCCQDCQFKGKTEICRTALDDCDFPEYCNGSSSECQENFVAQDGTPCGMDLWLCIGGECKSGDKQCISTITGATQFGSDQCFIELNTKGDISGNCGPEGDGYKKCELKDVKCGKLICVYNTDTVIKKAGATVAYANAEKLICVSLDYPYGHEKSNEMWVKDGTKCGNNQVCRNKVCEDASYLGYDCPPEKCNSRGSCNNKKNCHCHRTYLPPNCENEDLHWPGGSIDSGNFPPSRRDRGVLHLWSVGGMPIKEARYIEELPFFSKPTRWPFFLLIPFFIILCVLLAILVKVGFQRRKWKTEDYTSDEKSESENETKE